MTHPRRRRIAGDESGLALILVLMVVTLLSILVLEFSYSTRVDSFLATNTRNAAQAAWLARSGVALAESALILDSVQKATDPRNFPPRESLLDTWARPVGPLPVADGFGAAGYAIVDRSGKFNLNSLSGGGTAIHLEMRKQLLQGILSEAGLETNLLFAVLDWVDTDSRVERQSGAEAEYYSNLRPPYVPRNGQFLSLDELALVRGFEEVTPEQWRMLREMLTVLPNNQLQINVNTAPESLLRGIFGAAGDPELADAVVAVRSAKPFLKLTDINQIPGMTQVPPLIRVAFVVRSTNFVIHAYGESGDVRRGVAVQVERPQGSRNIKRVGWREEAFPSFLTTSQPSGGIPPA